MEYRLTKILEEDYATIQEQEKSADSLLLHAANEKEYTIRGKDSDKIETMMNIEYFRNQLKNLRVLQIFNHTNNGNK